MTDILLVCNSRGELTGLSAKGHAGFAEKGSDIVCSAESILMGTALELLENTRGLSVKSDTASRGTLAFSVEVSAGLTEKEKLLLGERLKCTADFLRSGLKSVSEQYPDYVQLREKSEE
ncbi:ribosomal-processing cysteine protease Prp [Treponema sp.]|uniref:ribosomal-processing cysteine protease Prp n=1 Tax=Treponema sp. TaxID=166 RepID=UPI0025FC8676|nr:ribosomal-processing cysteine protease Prp [Treponema sp.]MCR5219266.1 ribosomal-processing cysteine protease Prp [Treponema sp.]